MVMRVHELRIVLIFVGLIVVVFCYKLAIIINRQKKSISFFFYLMFQCCVLLFQIKITKMLCA